MPELDRGKAAMGVNGLGDQRQRPHVILVPQGEEAVGLSSELGWIEQYSVQTTPQPPSALMPRSAAEAWGFMQPRPVACGVW